MSRMSAWPDGPDRPRQVKVPRSDCDYVTVKSTACCAGTRGSWVPDTLHKQIPRLSHNPRQLCFISTLYNRLSMQQRTEPGDKVDRYTSHRARHTNMAWIVSVTAFLASAFMPRSASSAPPPTSPIFPLSSVAAKEFTGFSVSDWVTHTIVRYASFPELQTPIEDQQGALDL